MREGGGVTKASIKFLCHKAGRRGLARGGKRRERCEARVESAGEGQPKGAEGQEDDGGKAIAQDPFYGVCESEVA